MKLTKILALTLVLLLAFSAMSVVSFAKSTDPDACTTCGGDGKTGEQNDVACTACFGTGKLAYLDLDATTTTVKDTKEIEQKYSATVNEDKTNGDVTKVQVSWSIATIEATVTIEKEWDPETLQWVDKEDGTTATADAVTASFDFVNLSSVKVGAQVTFAAESGFNPTTAFKVDDTASTFGYKNLDTKSNSCTDAARSAKIDVTVTPGADDFKSKTENVTAEKYGTYTVKISKPLYSVSVEYYTANFETSTETFLVPEDTAISVDVSNRQIQIGSNEAVTSCERAGHAFANWGEKGVFEQLATTVTKDIIIIAKYNSLGA